MFSVEQLVSNIVYSSLSRTHESLPRKLRDGWLGYEAGSFERESVLDLFGHSREAVLYCDWRELLNFVEPGEFPKEVELAYDNGDRYLRDTDRYYQPHSILPYLSFDAVALIVMWAFGGDAFADGSDVLRDRFAKMINAGVTPQSMYQIQQFATRNVGEKSNS